MTVLDPDSQGASKRKPLSLAQKFAILTKLDRSKHTPIKVELTMCCAGLPRVDDLSKGDFQVMLYKKRRSKREDKQHTPVVLPGTPTAAFGPSSSPPTATPTATAGTTRTEAAAAVAVPAAAMSPAAAVAAGSPAAPAEAASDTTATGAPAATTASVVPAALAHASGAIRSADASTSDTHTGTSRNGLDDKRRWTLVGRTEVVRGSLAPRFSRTFVINYWPGKVQPLMAVVVEVEDYGIFKTREVVGECTFMLAELHDHPDKEMEMDLVAVDQPAETYVGTLDVGLEQVTRVMHLDMWTDVLFYADSGTMGRFQGRPMSLQRRALPVMEAPAFLHTMRDVEKQRDAGRSLARMSAMQRFFTLRRRRHRRARRGKQGASGRTFAQYSQRALPQSQGGQGGQGALGTPPAQRLSTSASQDARGQGPLTTRPDEWSAFTASAVGAHGVPPLGGANPLGGSDRIAGGPTVMGRGRPPPQNGFALPPPQGATGGPALPQQGGTQGASSASSSGGRSTPDDILAERAEALRWQLQEQDERHRKEILALEEDLQQLKLQNG